MELHCLETFPVPPPAFLKTPQDSREHTLKTADQKIPSLTGEEPRVQGREQFTVSPMAGTHRDWGAILPAVVLDLVTAMATPPVCCAEPRGRGSLVGESLSACSQD